MRKIVVRWEYYRRQMRKIVVKWEHDRRQMRTWSSSDEKDRRQMRKIVVRWELDCRQMRTTVIDDCWKVGAGKIGNGWRGEKSGRGGRRLCRPHPPEINHFEFDPVAPGAAARGVFVFFFDAISKKDSIFNNSLALSLSLSLSAV